MGSGGWVGVSFSGFLGDFFRFCYHIEGVSIPDFPDKFNRERPSALVFGRFLEPRFALCYTPLTFPKGVEWIMADESKKTVFRRVAVPEEQKKKYLVWNTPPYLGKPVELGKDGFTIGREEGRDLVIPSEMVSRNHAVLLVKETKIFLKDTGSSNGTFLNNQRIESEQPYELKHTDILKFDTFEFIFVDSARADLWETLKPLNRVGAITICVYSPKGGTGITSLVTNLAYSLSDLSKKKVAIADFNLRFGDVLTYSQGKPGKSFYELSQETEITGENIGGYLQQGPGYAYLPAPGKIEFAELIRPEHARKALWSLTQKHDYVLVDLKNEIDEITLITWETSNQIWLLLHPELGQMLALRKILELMDKLKYSEKVKIVVNGVGRPGTPSVDEIKAMIRKPFLTIPYAPDDAIVTTNQGLLFTKERSESELAMAICNLGRAIRGEEEVHAQVGIFSKLKSMLGL
jgi:MinD-like ATPase involved in chromosome partitioning or flagellar assembly